MSIMPFTVFNCANQNNGLVGAAAQRKSQDSRRLRALCDLICAPAMLESPDPEQEGTITTHKRSPSSSIQDI